MNVLKSLSVISIASVYVIPFYLNSVYKSGGGKFQVSGFLNLLMNLLMDLLMDLLMNLKIDEFVDGILLMI